MPKWLNDAVFYEIYPQSFYDTNADGIGDLPGIIAKLDYIKELGCNALWINPCFDSPFYDAGYDVRDFYKIAARYGTNEDARTLFYEAHIRGIHVMFDLVAGHTSIEHEWFKKSMQLKENEFSGRYIWADSVWERFEGVTGITGSISGFCDKGSCAVNFYSTQPSLNYGYAKITQPWQHSVDSQEARATQNALLDIMRFWLDMGCDGFRVDMAASLVKDDEDQVETIKLWQKIRKELNAEYPDAALVSEWGEPTKALQAGFDMDFLLHFGPTHYMTLFREAPFFSQQGTGCVASFVENYIKMLADKPEHGLICLPSSNHDMPRISQSLNHDELKIAFAFILSMPGAPFIYYGDEIGMRYLEDATPVEGGMERTGSRSPMQWDTTLNAGFSSCRKQDLYIPIDPDSKRPSVSEQIEDDNSLWKSIQKLITLRKEYEPLQSHGDIEFLHMQKQTSLLVYRRGKGVGSIIVALNPWNTAAEMPVSLDDYHLIHTVGDTPYSSEGKVVLAPSSAAFYVLKG